MSTSVTNLDQLNAMSDEEIKEMTAKVGRRAMKKFVVTVAVAVGVVIAIDRLTDKFFADDNEDESDTDSTN